MARSSEEDCAKHQALARSFIGWRQLLVRQRVLVGDGRLFLLLSFFVLFSFLISQKGSLLLEDRWLGFSEC